MRKIRRIGTLAIVFITIFSLLGNLKAEVVDEDKVGREAAQAFIQYCLSLKIKDYAAAFSLEPRFTQEEAGNVENYKKWWSEPPEMEEWRALYAAMEIEKVEILTPKRTAILINPIDERVANLAFYVFQENGKWKVGSFVLIFIHIKTDLEKLNNVIVRYNEKNKRLPEELSELTPEYVQELPLDLFNDKGEPYRYVKEKNENFIIYSFGPDSDDDLGMVKYDYENGLLSNGDIIIRNQ